MIAAGPPLAESPRRSLFCFVSGKQDAPGGGVRLPRGCAESGAILRPGVGPVEENDPLLLGNIPLEETDVLPGVNSVDDDLPPFSGHEG